MPNSHNSRVWLTTEQAITLNKMQVAETGEPHLVRDEGLLESALAAPKNLFAYDGISDVLTLSVRLMYSIGQNHPFMQGNKRTAFIAGIAFVEMNGLFVELPSTERFADHFIDLVTDRVSEREFRALMRPYVLDPASAKKLWKT